MGGKGGIKFFVILVLLLFSVPIWLPRSLGGEVSYHFVLTGSMKGSVDRGSFVIVRQGSNYQIGDVVLYQQPFGEGQTIPILHRVVGYLPDGGYITKGDANPNHEEVAPEAVLGRMALALPWLGFAAGASRSFPLILGVLVLTPIFFLGRKKQREMSLFLPALFLALFSFPFYSLGLAASLGKLPAFLLVLGFLGATRIAEMSVLDEQLRCMVGLNYILVIVLALSMVFIPGVIDSFRAVAGL